MVNWPTGQLYAAVIVSLEPILWAVVGAVVIAIIIQTRRIARG